MLNLYRNQWNDGLHTVTRVRHGVFYICCELTGSGCYLKAKRIRTYITTGGYVCTTAYVGGTYGLVGMSMMQDGQLSLYTR